MSNGQMRMIYALARQAGMDNDTLHDVAYGITGKESLCALTGTEGARVIERLKAYMGTSGDIPDRATQKQQWLIRRIEAEMGWRDDPSRLRGLVEKVTGVSDMRFLTVKQARKVIEALKAMQHGGRGERRRAKNELDGRGEGVRSV